jgi:antitoxin component YwqK of YwqJK toxin-antitoxin module
MLFIVSTMPQLTEPFRRSVFGGLPLAVLGACALVSACGSEASAPVVTPSAPPTPVVVEEVGAPQPIQVPSGLKSAPIEATPSQEALPAVEAQAPDREDWAGTELREERYPDGKPKLSRRVRRTEDGIENHGPFRKWATNGVLLEEGTFRAGEKEGAYVVRHENGLVKSEIHYLRGREHGRKREWGEYGVLLSDATLVDGVLDGEERTWWPDKNPRTLSTWKLGVLDGPSRVWHGNGIVAEEGQSVAGKREGTWTYRSSEDRLALVENYLLGRLHGVTTEYDAEGRKSAEREYRDGRASGVHREFWPSGKPRAETTFVDGKPQGPSARWYEDGVKECEGGLVGGQREGRWSFWKSDGSLDVAQSGDYRAGARVGP